MITYSELLETIQTITNIVMLCYVIFEPKNESFIIRSSKFHHLSYFSGIFNMPKKQKDGTPGMKLFYFYKRKLRIKDKLFWTKKMSRPLPQIANGFL